MPNLVSSNSTGTHFNISMILYFRYLIHHSRIHLKRAYAGQTHKLCDALSGTPENPIPIQSNRKGTPPSAHPKRRYTALYIPFIRQ